MFALEVRFPVNTKWHDIDVLRLGFGLFLVFRLPSQFRTVSNRSCTVSIWRHVVHIGAGRTAVLMSRA